MIVFDLLNFLVCCCPLNFLLTWYAHNVIQTPILWSHGLADKTVLFEAGQAAPPFLEKIGVSCEFKVKFQVPYNLVIFSMTLQFCPYQYWHFVLLGLSWSGPLDKQRGAKASWVLDQSTPTEFLLIFNLYLLHCNSIIWIYACTSCTSADLCMTFSIFTLLFTIFNRIEILDLISLWEKKIYLLFFFFSWSLKNTTTPWYSFAFCLHWYME